MVKTLFGSHISSQVGLLKEVKAVHSLGGNFVQIFSPKEGTDLNQFATYIKKHNIGVVIHSSYMHNIAREWDAYSWWITGIQREIEIAHRLGAIGVVIHMGKQLDLTKEEAYNNMYTTLLYLHKTTQKQANVKLIMETSTGQGSEMCYKLEDLAYFYKKFSQSPNRELRDRVKLCVDTCHIFSAGYSIRTLKEATLFVETFEEMVGLQNVCLIHLNDCKVPHGSQVDRHESIGKGYIGFPVLKYLFDYFHKLGVPIVLETPDPGYPVEIPMLLKNTKQ